MVWDSCSTEYSWKKMMSSFLSVSIEWLEVGGVMLIVLSLYVLGVYAFVLYLYTSNLRASCGCCSWLGSSLLPFRKTNAWRLLSCGSSCTAAGRGRSGKCSWRKGQLVRSTHTAFVRYPQMPERRVCGGVCGVFVFVFVLCVVMSSHGCARVATASSRVLSRTATAVQGPQRLVPPVRTSVTSRTLVRALVTVPYIKQFTAGGTCSGNPQLRCCCGLATVSAESAEHLPPPFCSPLTATSDFSLQGSVGRSRDREVCIPHSQPKPRPSHGSRGRQESDSQVAWHRVQ